MIRKPTSWQSSRRRRTTVDGELVAQGEVLEGQVAMAAV